MKQPELLVINENRFIFYFLLKIEHRSLFYESDVVSELLVSFQMRLLISCLKCFRVGILYTYSDFSVSKLS